MAAGGLTGCSHEAKPPIGKQRSSRGSGHSVAMDAQGWVGAIAITQEHPHGQGHNSLQQTHTGTSSCWLCEGRQLAERHVAWFSCCLSWERTMHCSSESSLRAAQEKYCSMEGPRASSRCLGMHQFNR